MSTVDPEKVRSVIRQRRDLAEDLAIREIPNRIISDEPWTAVVRAALGEETPIAKFVTANSPAAVIALCDGAERLLNVAERLIHSELHAEWCTGIGMLDQLSAMFGVSQEGTP